MDILAVGGKQTDLEQLRDMIRQAVPQAKVHSFSDPCEAVPIVRDTGCEAVFLDTAVLELEGIAFVNDLKGLKPEINIIFVSDDFKYAEQAFQLRVSGYLSRPVSVSDIITEIEHLRYPVQKRSSGIFIKTFGNFDLSVNGKSVPFHRSKAKEVLAYLVDRRGSSVTRREIASALFEDQEYSRNLQNYLTKIIKELTQTLEDAGIGNILVRSVNSYAVDPNGFRCDLYEYEDKNATAEQIDRFRGEYMAQYSWAEPSLAYLLWKRGKI